MLAALCDILELSPAELIVTSAANIAPCNAVSGEALAPVDLAMVRPRRARVLPGLMDHPCATTEQYERWFIRICARCGRRSSFTARWPDGASPPAGPTGTSAARATTGPDSPVAPCW